MNRSKMKETAFEAIQLLMDLVELINQPNAGSAVRSGRLFLVINDSDLAAEKLDICLDADGGESSDEGD